MSAKSLSLVNPIYKELIEYMRKYVIIYIISYLGSNHRAKYKNFI